MASRYGRWMDSLDRPRTLLLLVLLAGVRFVAATVTAFAGVEGMDTRGIDSVFEVYADVLIVLWFLVAALGLAQWGPSLRARPGFLIFLGLSGLIPILWVAVVTPELHVWAGVLAPYLDFLLGTAAAAALAVVAWVLVDRLASAGASRLSRDGLRAFGGGFAAALLLRSVRLLDFTYLFAWTPPPGLLWTLDFGPTLLLAALAVILWARIVMSRRSSSRDLVRALAPPVVLAAIAWAAAVGVLGGFIASNALAWGGSYIVFAPTVLSLPIVGFAVGAFVSTAWNVRGPMEPPAKWLVFGGIALATLTGIQTSAGTLASFAGLLAGIVVTARGLAKLASPLTKDQGSAHVRI